MCNVNEKLWVLFLNAKVLDKFQYILQEPYYTLWFNFHFEKAILRWVSKEGNTFAHKLYSG
jgi:hypothetical protein